jgi:hypothetical protein
MADSGDEPETRLDLGVYGRRPPPSGMIASDWIAAALTVVWVLSAGIYLLGMGGPPEGTGALTFLMLVVAVFLPVALLWVAAAASRSARMWRADAERLQAAIDALRQSQAAQPQPPRPQAIPAQAIPAQAAQLQAAAAQGPVPAPTQPLAQETAQDPAPRQSNPRRGAATSEPPRGPHAMPATFVSRREPVRAAAVAPAPSPPPAAADGQSSLALGQQADHRPLPLPEAIRALNFPEDVNDREGFRALRRALEDAEVGRLVRASQDVLTLLSQDGLYMDDLAPDRARPEVWRRFASGERGGAIANLGGVRDRTALAMVIARMRRDVVFRDTAHHFLRHFDRTFATLAPRASDEEIADFAETRTARAFMLLARAAGTFD